jgi:NitT/TauT family transport system permease protein
MAENQKSEKTGCYTRYVIGSEFIMARSGMGYEISYAYTNFDNTTMYPLILLILLLSIAANGLLSHWERVLLARRGQK